MQSRLFQWVMLGFWLTVIIGLFTREWWMPQPFIERVEARGASWMIGVAVLLAGWNIVRLYSLSRPPVPTRVSPATPIPRERRAPGVIAPEFQFDDDKKNGSA